MAGDCLGSCLSRGRGFLYQGTPNLIGEQIMFKKMLLAAIAAGLVSAATLPLQIGPAEASLRGLPCKEAAKMKYPGDRKMRHAWKKLCKANWALHQGG
jgi:hypothetical protein